MIKLLGTALIYSFIFIRLMNPFSVFQFLNYYYYYKSIIFLFYLLTQDACKNDFGNFVVERQLTPKEIYDCLTMAQIPPITYTFPEYIVGKQKRRFLHKYLAQFPQLTYSKKYEGAKLTVNVV